MTGSFAVPPPFPRRIGVFGGAFDPPHVAHVALAKAAVVQFALDRLMVLPTGQAWHKTRSLTASKHRLAMAQLTFGSLPKTEVDDREIRRDGPTYTIDTLAQLQAENPTAQLYLVIGADQARALMAWHRWEELLRIAIISVAVRFSDREAKLAVAVAKAYSGPLPNDFSLLVAGLPEPLQTQGRFELLQCPPMAVSATDVRHRVANGLESGPGGLGIADLVTEPVARYIAKNHLYLAPR